MYNKKKRLSAKWLTGFLFILCLTFLTGKSAYAQKFTFGDIPLDPKTYQKYLKILPEDMVMVSIPIAYDARDDKIVTPAKDQGACASCWAFASVGAMESHIMKKFSVSFLDLSEQQQVSCNLTMLGCCGGRSDAIRYWESSGSIYESCFPYAESIYSCPILRTVSCSSSDRCIQLLYRVVNWHTVDIDVLQFKISLYNEGPSYWRFDIYDDFLTFWMYGDPGEVYINNVDSTFNGGHAVLLIGWDNNKGAYLCKNSWGEHGGPNGDGTFWIAYEGHAHNLRLGMANFDLIVECNNNGLCEPDEDCVNCPNDCISSAVPGCGNGFCESFIGEDCLFCPGDCAGKQDGKPNKRYCCGDGDGENPISCDNKLCNSNGYSCIDSPLPYFCCGDKECEGAETQCNCPVDCGEPPDTEDNCVDAEDNDCDGLIDCDDSDCVNNPTCFQCLEKKEACEEENQCCIKRRCISGQCR